MKKHLFGLFAMLIAVAIVTFSSFSAPKLVVADYFVYNSGPENDVDSYTQQSTAPTSCSGSATVCSILVEDRPNDGNSIVDEADFNAVFDAIDDDNDNTLADEPETAPLEKKGI